MRLNKYIAQSTGVSRREADELISSGRVVVNDKIAQLGEPVSDKDVVSIGDKQIKPPQTFTYLLINKPVGYVSTRSSQDNSPTVYDLVPEKYHRLKYVGRLDKNSSGALLLTDDGDFAHRMTHPSHEKSKIYRLKLDKPLALKFIRQIETGVQLSDGVSQLKILASDSTEITVEMSEGRNRQIRRTMDAIGYMVNELHRIKFGPYELHNLKPGDFIEVKKLEV